MSDDGAPPLCVDLDGTLVATDTLHESLLVLARRRPLDLAALPFWLLGGRARMKARVADRVTLNAASLPYREDVLEFLRAEKAAGRRLVLATASDERVANAVADHLGLFDAVIGSDGARNEKGAAKVEGIRACLGDVPFDYLGDSRADLPVWAAARASYVVDPSRSLLSDLQTLRPPERVFVRSGSQRGRGGRPGRLLAALRPHQWAKNALLVVPLLTSHTITELPRLLAALLGIAAFSLVASAGYVLNDLLDLEADREHPTKRARPFASGALTPAAGVVLFFALVIAGFAVALTTLPAAFGWMLAAYFVATVSYSVYLKRKLLLDVIVLAGLYTLRVLAGGAATDIVVSQWLLAFSMFIFLSLAFAKRYAELQLMAAAQRDTAKGRGYRVDEIDLVQSVGSTSGILSVLVFSLYVSSNEVTLLYAGGRVQLLWLTCPVFLYWILRIWFLARRGELTGDPVTFALRDRSSLVAGLLLAAILWAASL